MLAKAMARWYIEKRKRIEVARFISISPDVSGTGESGGKENAPKEIYS